MRKMILGLISILAVYNIVYAAGNEEHPATAPTATLATAPSTTPTPAAAPAATPAAAPAVTPSSTVSASLSGKWSSNLVGNITLEQTGNKITGAYQYKDDDGVTQDGKIEGLVNDKIIQAKWWERPKVGSGEESRGDLEWKIADDGKALTGWYREEGEKEKQDWNLER